MKILLKLILENDLNNSTGQQGGFLWGGGEDEPWVTGESTKFLRSCYPLIIDEVSASQAESVIRFN